MIISKACVGKFSKQVILVAKVDGWWLSKASIRDFRSSRWLVSPWGIKKALKCRNYYLTSNYLI